jgi:TolB-like protein/Tfp pilus assembly protein PilF
LSLMIKRPYTLTPSARMLDSAKMSDKRNQQERKAKRMCRFGDFEVDLVAGELRKKGIKLKLSGQPFAVLRLLLDQPGELVRREALRSHIWANDTFVDFEHGLNAAVNKLRETLSDTANHPRYIETLHRRGYRFIAPVQRWPANNPLQPIRAITVLPLQNGSRDPEQDYFVDGMTEALITDLAKIRALRVISQPSRMRQKQFAEIARELNVDAIVEGAVRRIGNRVRIAIRLIHQPSGTHVWAESYERDLNDVFALQSEVARAIATEIRIALSSKEQLALERSHIVLPAAYEAYLRGRFYWNKRTAKDVKKSIDCFRQATELHPEYALAWAAMADAYLMLGSMVLEVIPPREAMPKARSAAQKALEIDDTLGEAHSTMAYIRAAYDYDWQAAQENFQRALALNPGYATAHHWYAVVLSRLGKLDLAQFEISKAHELDPLSLQINSEMAAISYLRRDYDQAIDQARRTLDLDAAFPTAHAYLALTYLQKKLFADALRHAKQAAESWGTSASSLGLMAGCYAASGKKREAREFVERLHRLSQRQYVPSFVFAWIDTLSGDKASALAKLERAYAERSSYLMLLKMEPSLDLLRSDSRFLDLERRVGLAS